MNIINLLQILFYISAIVSNLKTLLEKKKGE